jgi:hypothetical protein
VKNFSDLLDPKFRWPAPDDKLFVSTDADTDADLDVRFEAREFLIREGYKNAADLLVEKARESNLDRDSLVYPIVFCYRHYLELALKALVATYGPGVEIKPNWKSHDLGRLWQSFIGMLARYDVEDVDGANTIVGELIREFASIDPASFSFRYPVDTEGYPIPMGRGSLDLTRLADVMDGVSGYFQGTDGYLGDLVSNMPGPYDEYTDEYGHEYDYEHGYEYGYGY